MHRRSVLAVAGASLAAGCSVLPGYEPSPIPPEEPNGDGTATLGELHYLLEDSDVEAYERLDVVSMERSGDVALVTYASAATDEVDFVNELGTIAALYGVYVGNGGTTDRLVIVVETNYPEQPRRLHVETEWVRQFNEGSLSGRDLTNQILATAEYETAGTDGS